MTFFKFGVKAPSGALATFCDKALVNDILADNLTEFTYNNSWSALGTSPKVWLFGKNDFDKTLFILFLAHLNKSQLRPINKPKYCASDIV